MPIPVATPDSSPRRLLRDVVLKQLQGAILDGTLEPGERLTDDELVAWLGVSRTPIREALLRLRSLGLVDVELNRYTRIGEPTTQEAIDALSALLAFAASASRRAVAAFTDADRAAFSRLPVGAGSAGAESIIRAAEMTLERGGNEIMLNHGRDLGISARFFAKAQGEGADWGTAALLPRLVDAIDAGDGAALAAAFTRADEYLSSMSVAG